MDKLCLESMSDDHLLERVEGIAVRSNQITAELLVYLAEVDRRGLYLGQATSSLFAFCLERLHMSEGAAGKRITAARVGRRFPVVLAMIARGELHLTAVNLLAAHLTEDNCAELLARARHRSKREIERLIAEIAPRPDVPSRLVALPRRAPADDLGGSAVTEHAPARVVCAPSPAPSPRAAVVAPLSPRRYELRVTLDEESHETLVRLQDLLAHEGPAVDPAVVVARALALLLERTLARKAAVTDRPREAPAAEKRTRNIPAAVRRAVWRRDKGQCAYIDGKGRRCSATRSLEFHHLRNWARGAEHEVSEMELRCRAHNQYQATLDYGAEFMAARRGGSSSRAEEPRRAYALGRASADRSLSRHRRGAVQGQPREQAAELEDGGVGQPAAGVVDRPGEGLVADLATAEHVADEDGHVRLLRARAGAAG
jgi:5-methylcytosine-specific restriction endonuclease McrA